MFSTVVRNIHDPHSWCSPCEFQEEEEMGDPMADDFLSSMVFIFKALFLKTLKFQLCRYFSLRWVDEFSWDKEQIVHNLCSYGSNSCNFKVFMCKYFFHDKNSKNSKNWKK